MLIVRTHSLFQEGGVPAQSHGAEETPEASRFPLNWCGVLCALTRLFQAGGGVPALSHGAGQTPEASRFPLVVA